MPYITQERREILDACLEELSTTGMVHCGELNYVITKIILTYLGGHSGYQGLDEAVGALECAKLEMYRRIVAPYEDKKIRENGDIAQFKTY